MGELAALFAASFAAATLIPLSSEAALYVYLQVHPDRAFMAVAVATAGNTAGGMTSYLLGRLIPQKEVKARAIELTRKYGAPATFFGWVPVIGDAVCVAAGWLRVNWVAVLLFMAAGRAARYIAVAYFFGGTAVRGGSLS